MIPEREPRLPEEVGGRGALTGTPLISPVHDTRTSHKSGWGRCRRAGRSPDGRQNASEGRARDGRGRGDGSSLWGQAQIVRCITTGRRCQGCDAALRVMHGGSCRSWFLVEAAAQQLPLTRVNATRCSDHRIAHNRRLNGTIARESTSGNLDPGAGKPRSYAHRSKAGKESHMRIMVRTYLGVLGGELNESSSRSARVEANGAAVSLLKDQATNNVGSVFFLTQRCRRAARGRYGKELSATSGIAVRMTD